MLFGLRVFGKGAFVVAVMAGCAGTFGGDAPLPAVTMAGGVIVAGPQGYCVDPSISSARTGLAVLAACSAIAGSEGSWAQRNALITVQLGDAGSATIAGSSPAVAAFLNTQQGRATLSRTGEGSTIEIRNVASSGDVVTVIFDDNAPSPIQGLSSREWRAFMDMRGRLLTVSVRSLAAGNVGSEGGMGLLSRTLAALNAANAAP